MDSVVRAAVTYGVVWLVFRIAGKRSLSEVTTFDFVLLLIVSETTQAALVDDDNSLTNSVVLICTFFGMEMLLSWLKQRFPRLDQIIDGTPLLLMADGSAMEQRMKREHVSEDDLLEAARELHGLERLDQIKYAVLERNGQITIVPK